MRNETIERPALGKIVSLGTFFDARSDNFLSSFSLLNLPTDPKLLREVVEVKDVHFTDLKVVTSESIQSKFWELGIGAEFGASLLGGIVKLDISGDFLKSNRSFENTAQASMTYLVKTVDETLKLNSIRAIECLAPGASGIVADGIATHVVSGISWGARCRVTAKRNLSDSEDRLKVSGAISASLSKFKGFKGGLGGRAEVGNLDDKSFKGLDITVVGDVLPDNNSMLPTDLESAYTFMENIQTYIAKIKSIHKLELSADLKLIQLNVKYLNEFVEYFDDMESKTQKLGDYQRSLEAHRPCIPPGHMREISEALSRVAPTIGLLKYKYGSVLREVRAGISDENKLVEALIECQKEPGLAQLTSLICYEDKMNFMDSVVSRGAKYCGFGTHSPRQFMTEHAADYEDTYVLSFEENPRLSDVGLRAYSLFLEVLRDHGTTKLFLIEDHESSDATGKHTSGPRIRLWRNNKVIDDDVLESYESRASKCVMRCDEAKFSPNDQAPRRRVAVKLECPSPRCDRKIRCIWSCYKCQSSLEYGYDNMLYCDCGSADYTHWEARCTDPKHGAFWYKHKSEQFLQLLEALELSEEMNILVMSQDDNEKSIFLNSFANYLVHPTLDDALAADQIDYLIPLGKEESQTARIDSDLEDHPKADNGPTSKIPQAYVFKIGDHIIRLIDVPNAPVNNDDEKDVNDATKVFSILHEFKKLHGVLILVSSPLTEDFKHHIKQVSDLLQAETTSQGIMFGFTTSDVTKYTSTMFFKVMQRFVRDKIGIELYPGINAFCFNAKGFLHLSKDKMLAHPRSMDESRRSWRDSVSECQKLLAHIKECRPWDVTSLIEKEEININQTATRFINSLGEYILDFFTRIRDYKKFRKDAKVDLELLREEKTILESKLSKKPSNGPDIEQSLRMNSARMKVEEKIICRTEEALREIRDSKRKLQQAAAYFVVILNILSNDVLSLPSNDPYANYLKEKINAPLWGDDFEEMLMQSSMLAKSIKMHNRYIAMFADVAEEGSVLTLVTEANGVHLIKSLARIPDCEEWVNNLITRVKGYHEVGWCYETTWDHEAGIHWAKNQRTARFFPRG